LQRIIGLDRDDAALWQGIGQRLSWIGLVSHGLGKRGAGGKMFQSVHDLSSQYSLSGGGVERALSCTLVHL
jgi:hypothetical protein